MSGEGKRGDAPPAKQPRPSSTLLLEGQRASGSVEAVAVPRARRSLSLRLRSARGGGERAACRRSEPGALASEDLGGGSRSRLEKAPQNLERNEFAPGNGMAPEASEPQDLGLGPLVEVFEPPRSSLGRSGRGRAGNRGRPEMLPQDLERIGFAPGNGMALEASDPQDLGPMRGLPV